VGKITLIGLYAVLSSLYKLVVTVYCYYVCWWRRWQCL